MLEPQPVRDYINAMWFLCFLVVLPNPSIPERIVRSEIVRLEMTNEATCRERMRHLDLKTLPTGFDRPWEQLDLWCEERPQAGV